MFFICFSLLLFQCVTSLMMLMTSDVFALINYYSQILWFSVALSIMGMLWLRRTQPDLPRPIRVNTAIPIIFIACCMFLVIFPMFSNPWNSVISIIITLSGKKLYFTNILFAFLTHIVTVLGFIFNEPQ